MEIASSAEYRVVRAPVRHATKRVGRGIGSRRGTTCTRGMNGQLARSGGGVRIGFEGGQMPIYRRLPRRGFSNIPSKIVYKTLPLKRIALCFTGDEEINIKSLYAKNLVKGAGQRYVKIISGEKITKKLNLNLSEVKASKSVVAAVEESGGRIIYNHQPVAKRASRSGTSREQQ